jgi:translation initiation factor IF-3
MAAEGSRPTSAKSSSSNQRPRLEGRQMVMMIAPKKK